ncbi:MULTISPECIES: bifunctional 2',3'-cyclic-nucleotide 2'-phosphodiesterase/3'-nucleotidase [unclassified Planococcus (in: firmicutes)]|uniref:bifunctional 2',3'-cyclic-nucleotide 2'-phosphodiesterase/3'-nucleotidase n=1 Tax=unclassified Planococcus (in: firmicutes) TaxID=2662419 RepID=UPI000C7B76F0|nr:MULTISPECIES: bifunctional 2',3'-cyclic-nucleotide 2'-phosphodiesterase/3'-nucleotidase [unclassified Planococcus (in: firmicutes)]PKG44776.1 bifunctional 2',3'-cyclic-nucleotide 2'-phosphodiesterase/3'-nucleotidase [Planococcus sp. Urea-trap-24]PKG87118.1 bifunctional 2',3'-cyclic-nucleotide 2'-phosphodiesterase/3'-nucleotidase [Planococcus sp. Urea-3u-39]PKH40222.1 bifunctional 2',3'-cyclic-nucleotide 2'-phosphodiesterase/3'-nucleotidase [Planococcus sp. MB-3u-09]
MSKKLSLTLAASVLALGSLTAGAPAIAAGDHHELAKEKAPKTVKGNGQSYKERIQEWKKNGKPGKLKEVELQILGTSDLHTNFVNYDYYRDAKSNSLSLAKTGVLIEDAREENPNSLLFDNGDLIQGTPFGGYKVNVDPLEDDELHPAFAALESLDFDASTLGNHEFNFGLEYLDNALEEASFPVLNANVYDAETGENRFTPYTIMDKEVTDRKGKKHTIQVGVIGVVAPGIMNWDRAHLEGEVIAEDAADTVEKFIPEVEKAGADVVVVLSHSGMGDEVHTDKEDDITYQLTEVDGVDAIITGHNHDVFPGSFGDLENVDQENGTINGVPVVMPGKFGSHLGVIDLTLEPRGKKWRITNSEAELRAIDSTSDEVAEQVIEAVKETHEGTVEYIRSPVGETTAPINSYFSLVQDDPSVQIVNNAQLWYAEQQFAGTANADLPLLSAAAPFKAGGRNGGDYYTNIETGEIAIKNVADLYVYDNTVFVLKLTGADVKEWLEMSAGQFTQIDPAATGEQRFIDDNYRTYNFDVIDGVTYDIDITEPAKYDGEGAVVNEGAERIENLQYEGAAIDPNQEFLVVTNNYRASGNFPGVRNATESIDFAYENRQVLQDYILDVGTIDPSADDNWQFAPVEGDPNLVFETSNSAQSLAEREPAIQYIEVTQNGFAKYGYTIQ